MIIMWLWSFVPKLKLVLGILGGFCIDIQDKVLGASEVGGKTAVCSHSGVLHLQRISSYFLIHFLRLFKVSSKSKYFKFGSVLFFWLNLSSYLQV